MIQKRIYIIVCIITTLLSFAVIAVNIHNTQRPRFVTCERDGKYIIERQWEIYESIEKIIDGDFNCFYWDSVIVAYEIGRKTYRVGTRYADDQIENLIYYNCVKDTIIRKGYQYDNKRNKTPVADTSTVDVIYRELK